jgi:hypothetical protein
MRLLLIRFTSPELLQRFYNVLVRWRVSSLPAILVSSDSVFAGTCNCCRRISRS